MISVILSLFLIQVIVCCIVDISGIIDSLKWLIWKLFCKGIGKPENITLKPIDCSCCMTFWSGLVYLICTGNITLPYLAILLLFAVLASNTTGFILTLKDGLVKLEMAIQKLLGL